MATTNELALADSLILGLDNYWTRANALPQNSDQRAQAQVDFNNARDAMDWLVSHAQYDAQIRQKLAQANIFSQALTREHNRIVDQMAMPTGVAAPGGLDWVQDLNPSFDNRPPRLILLQGLRRWAGGTFISPPEKEGITPWILDEELGQAAVVNTLLNDPYPAVVLELLSILATCAYPAAWALARHGELFGSQAEPSQLAQALAEVLSALPFNLCPIPDDNRTRISNRSGGFCTAMPAAMLQAFSATAKNALGRVQLLTAQPAIDAVLNNTAPLPPGWTSPTTGNNRRVPTPPPPPRKWWRDGRYWSMGALGLLGGMMAANRTKSRR